MSYKKKYEELKARTDIDNKIQQHTQSYIHISFSWSGIGRFVALLGSIALSLLNLGLLISIGNTYKVWNLLSSKTPEKEYYSLSQLTILYPLIGEYLLIILSFICLAALIKGGFNQLKSYTEDGLIGGLIVGLIVGLIGGLIVGLIVGPIVGLIVGLISGLISGLIVGLIGGLTQEFK